MARTRPSIAIVLSAVLCVGLLPASSAGALTTVERGTTVRRSWPLGVGIRLTRIRKRRAPNEIRILTVIPQRRSSAVPDGPRVDVKAAGSLYPMYRAPSAIAAAGRAAATVNGDFVIGGRTAHLSMIDGELWTTGIHQGSAAIGFAADGRRAFVGYPHMRIHAARFGTGGFDVAGWNAHRPAADEVQGYTRRGGMVVRPPGRDKPTRKDQAYCAVRLIPSGHLGWTGDAKAGLARVYEVDAQPDPCEKTPLAIGVEGNVVLATRAKSARAGRITALEKGQTVRVSWGVEKWPGVTDIIGAQPVILRDGENIAPGPSSGSSYFLDRNPRTAVGIDRGCKDRRTRSECHIFIVTVDGRQSEDNWSRGMRLPELADLLRRLGAVDAVNLDGGGGTEMWVARRRTYCQQRTDVGGCLVSRPSGGGERSTVVALTVLPGIDRGEPLSVR
jgi:hypothetical protein